MELNDQNKKTSRQIDPNRAWKFIVLLSLTLILFAFVFGFYVWKKVNILLVSPGAIVSENNILSKEDITQVLKYFADREEKSRQIISSPSPVIDPSL